MITLASAEPDQDLSTSYPHSSTNEHKLKLTKILSQVGKAKPTTVAIKSEPAIFVKPQNHEFQELRK